MQSRPMIETGTLGGRLRALRTERGLSLKEVAAETDLSASFISMVETGQSDITVGRLMRLVSFYRMTLPELFDDSSVPSSDIIRAGEGRHIHSPSEGVDYYVMAPDIRRQMSAVHIVYEPGCGMIDYDQHPGEEWTYVLEGELELRREGAPPVILGPGDTAYYSGQQPHAYRNVGTGRARMLGVVTPARF
jgi:transcriptional regulator with XRE-family HTH domain